MLEPKAVSLDFIEQLVAHNGSISPVSDLDILTTIINSHKIPTEIGKNIIKEFKSNKAPNLHHILHKMGHLSAKQLVLVDCARLGVPYISLKDFTPDTSVLHILNQETAIRYNLLPLAVSGGKLVVAFTDPTDQIAFNAAQFGVSYPIIMVVAEKSQLYRAIEKHYTSTEIDDLVKAVASDIDIKSNTSHINKEQLERLANQQPMVQLVNNIIFTGIKDRASDINIRPTKDETIIFYRIDGQMIEYNRLNAELLNPMVARIKIVTHMDVVEHRIPQDGHAHLNYLDRKIDLRISIMPTVLGESVVIRILDSKISQFNIDELGMLDQQLNTVESINKRNNGIFLLTGPTGSGKSTTLYSLLNQRKASPRHIITVEDPVEYQIEGIEQININTKIGYTFQRALRNILRHDPDDILIGEMRDFETAEIAISASLTGHFVMSTLHTNDAPSSVTRLIEMGVEPYLVSSSLLGVLAQRLIRRLCEKCKIKTKGDPKLMAEFGIDEDLEIYKAGHCSHCHQTGFKGRLMICEILEITPTIRDMITQNIAAQQIREAAQSESMLPMIAHAAELVKQGITTLNEALIAKIEV